MIKVDSGVLYQGFQLIGIFELSGIEFGKVY